MGKVYFVGQATIYFLVDLFQSTVQIKQPHI